jgi:hypothetical protein
MILLSACSSAAPSAATADAGFARAVRATLTALAPTITLVSSATSILSELPTIVPTSRPAPYPTVSLSLIARIAYANGYDWHLALESDKIALCKWMSRNVLGAFGSAPEWRYFYSGLNEFYNTTDSFILEQKIDSIAGGLLLLYQ